MQQVVVILTLAGTILSISATLSALMLTDEFGEIPFRASKHTTQPDNSTIDSESVILRSFGARKSTQWLIVHCERTVYLPTSAFLITVQGWYACY